MEILILKLLNLLDSGTVWGHFKKLESLKVILNTSKFKMKITILKVLILLDSGTLWGHLEKIKCQNENKGQAFRKIYISMGKHTNVN